MNAVMNLTADQQARFKQFTERDAIKFTMIYGYQSNDGAVVHRQNHIEIVETQVDGIKHLLGGVPLMSTTPETFNAEEKYFSDHGWIVRGGNWDYNGNLDSGEAQYNECGFAEAIEYHEPRLSKFVDLLVEVGIWTLGHISGHEPACTALLTDVEDERLPVAANDQKREEADTVVPEADSKDQNILNDMETLQSFATTVNKLVDQAIDNMVDVESDNKRQNIIRNVRRAVLSTAKVYLTTA